MRLVKCKGNLSRSFGIEGGQDYKKLRPNFKTDFRQIIKLCDGKLTIQFLFKGVKVQFNEALEKADNFLSRVRR